MSGTRRRSAFTRGLVRSPSEGTPRVEDDLRRAILSGDEPPGTLIPIEAVARFFGVSQIPVREALKVLQGEGLVEHVPHVGYSVSKMSFAEFRELYDVRQALEAAAMRAAVARAAPAHDDAVRSAYQEMDAAVAHGDVRAYHVASRSFHRALITPSGMERMVHMYDSAWNMTEPAQPMARVPETLRGGLHDDHLPMMAAFLARDAEALVAHAATHYARLREAIDTFAGDPDVFR
ncbi:GntR family transcriptional regulator [Nocardioides acrostichi]|uniref:GntR family transcriptional regulator n=1 Tax=Nocardioides acrostichi TaxID=2784339 RepID=A0A930UUT9_9ACTN|nr:GntR family transcriptional regulator [Nocardioides acrostichi]MBF4161253.1 GntR family transcriptional regulator [Nocardioides acrostichi]